MKPTQQLEAEARQFMSQGDFQNSIHTLNQALGIAQTSKPLDLPLIARLFNNLGLAHRELRDLPTAEKYFQSQYRRLAAGRGKHRAAVAVGHSLLVTGYHLITRQLAYKTWEPITLMSATPRRSASRATRLPCAVAIRCGSRRLTDTFSKTGLSSTKDNFCA